MYPTITLRCTAKLRKELGQQPVVQSESGWAADDPTMDEWHANLVRFGSQKCILITHSLTLYSVWLIGVRKARYARLGADFRQGLADQMRVDGLGDVNQLLPDPVRVVVAKSNRRGVLGSMVDLANLFQHDVELAGGLRKLDLETWSRRVNIVPMIGYLKGQSADTAMASALASVHG